MMMLNVPSELEDYMVFSISEESRSIKIQMMSGNINLYENNQHHSLYY